MAGNRSRIATPQANLAAAPDVDTAPSQDKRPTREQIEKREPKAYRALARGYVDGTIIEEGEVFVTKADKGSWMEPLRKSKQTAVERAVDDTISPLKDGPDLTTFSKEALEAEALRLGLTNAKGLDKDDLITAITAAYENEAQ